MDHPILTAVEEVDRALKSVADVDPVFMTGSDQATALSELVRLESRLVELRLRVMAAAECSGEVAASDGSRDLASWLAAHTRIRWEDARADLRLARALDRDRPVLAAALREGRATVAQARVVVHALDELPAETQVEVVARAEDALTGHCARFTPRQLIQLGRRVLAHVAPETAEEVEARQLAAQESDAHRRTRLCLRPRGDGTTRISGVLPDATASRLATYLHAFTNPRRDHSDAAGQRPERLPYPRRAGQAFCQLLESVDPTRLPRHGGGATTVVVTMTLQALRSELSVAELGDDTAISAAEARRLACSAGIIPAVLGRRSEILDLGRRQRLFTPAQHKALLIRDRTCRAEGCTIPGTWCEAHHLDPWSRGGATDLGNGVLLCAHHHHRIHDPGYHHQPLPDGQIVFRRPTPVQRR